VGVGARKGDTLGGNRMADPEQQPDLDTVAPSALPVRFVERLTAIVGPERIDAALASFRADKPTAFRVNTLKASPGIIVDALLASGLTPVAVEGVENAYTVPPAQREVLTHRPEVAEGVIYIQGIASMLAPLVLDPRPDEEVLDLCAAPGGKTLMMAAMMNNEGTLNAVELGVDRWHRLRANLQRAGATMVKTYRSDGAVVGRKTPGRFDKSLVDAPCTGEARFDEHDPASYNDWSEKKIARCARVQKALLRSALDAVHVGGTVLYATCSMAPEENETVVAHTLRRMGDRITTLPIAPLPAATMPAITHWMGKPIAGDRAACVSRAVRVLPTDQHDAFFLCLLRRNS